MAPAVMGRRKKEPTEPLVPAQDKRICGGICLCQMTFVLSSVALVYLSVAVYAPSYKAFTSGIEAEPVMCQTVNTSRDKDCRWTSCYEWCLSKSSGVCPQIHVTTRRNGTHLLLQDCHQPNTTNCPKADLNKLEKFNCNNETLPQCATMNGIWKCSLGHCSNFSELFLCHNKADGILVNPKKENLKLNGFFDCTDSRCVKFRTNMDCDRYCPWIPTGASVYVHIGDTIWSAECASVAALSESNGNAPGRELESPENLWTAAAGNVLMVSCLKISPIDNTTFQATDCLNGTLHEKEEFEKPSINFTRFWAIEAAGGDPVDKTQRFLPDQSALTIYNYSRLFINLDGCVNTLRGECSTFFETHDNDGENKTAQDRFTCFYRKGDDSLVVTQFDLDKTWKQLIVSLTVPAILFVVSFTSLLIIGYTVRVGDDTKMRCEMCPSKKRPSESEPPPQEEAPAEPT